MALALAVCTVAGPPALAETDAGEPRAVDGEARAVLGETHSVPGDFATIQACIDAAQDGDECLVAPGTYHELIDFLGKAITLRSSDGAEVTIIDADPVEDNGNGKSVVSCVSGEGSGTILDGFTITGGTGTPTIFRGHYGPRGGGMFNQDSNPTVINCTFSENTVGGSGGGMYNINSSPTVADCAFIRNAADLFGGGMYNGGGSSPTVTMCAFHGNVAGGGGGMRNGQGSRPNVTKCAFNENVADRGGGMSSDLGTPTVNDCSFDGNLAYFIGGGMYVNLNVSVVTNCIFTRNRAGWGGGGMFTAGDFDNPFLSPTVDNCLFSDNRASQRGGGMFNDQGNPTVVNCVFAGNLAPNGGGMYNLQSGVAVTNCTFEGNTGINAGGMYNEFNSPTLIRCAFTGNTAFDGGGMFNNDTSPTLNNCMFGGNTALRGGGMSNLLNSTPTVVNCTFSGNVADNDGGGMFNSHSTPALTHSIIWGNTPDEVFNSNAFPHISFSDVQHSGGSGDWDASLGFDGGGYIDADPLFVREPNPRLNGWDGVDDDFGKLTLKARSPAINAGDPAFVVEEGAFDLAGQPRLRGCRIDMGAYESPAGQGRGDFNFDGDSDLADFAAFQLCFGGDDANPNWRRDCHCVFGNGDDDQADKVELEDFARFLPAMSGPR